MRCTAATRLTADTRSSHHNGSVYFLCAVACHTWAFLGVAGMYHLVVASIAPTSCSLRIYGVPHCCLTSFTTPDPVFLFTLHPFRP